MNERHSGQANLPIPVENLVLTTPHQGDGILAKLADRFGGKRKREKESEEITGLTRVVLKKLLEDISKNGIVSQFHDKITGSLVTEIYSAYFTSPKLHQLGVMVWKNYNPQEAGSDIEGANLHMQVLAHSDGARLRCLKITEQAANPDMYMVDISRDSHTLSHRQQIDFLQEVLATEVDEESTATKFGRPYQPGDTFSSEYPESADTHRASWIRDGVHKQSRLT